MDDSGHARIGGFGEFAVESDESTSEDPREIGLTTRWAAPEAFQGNTGKKSDIFSFAMVMIEVPH